MATQVIDNNGLAPEGYKGGKIFNNMPKEEGAQKLPEGVTYKEYDVNPYVKGQNRGMERIVIGDDGSVWYTNDHYFTFKKLK
ncbi:MAG: ribonuclease domain-containing protein [Thomasclavelia sp.]|nr:ribonuclease domain-containing protein [Thomasclavelia sp.]